MSLDQIQVAAWVVITGYSDKYLASSLVEDAGRTVRSRFQMLREVREHSAEWRIFKFHYDRDI